MNVATDGLMVSAVFALPGNAVPKFDPEITIGTEAPAAHVDGETEEITGVPSPTMNVLHDSGG